MSLLAATTSVEQLLAATDPHTKAPTDPVW